MYNKVYIIVLWHNGIPHFLQTNNKVAWCFEHLVKAYVRYGSAKNAVKNLAKRYKFDHINVYYINYSASFSSSDFLQGKFDKDIVYTLVNS